MLYQRTICQGIPDLPESSQWLDEETLIYDPGTKIEAL